MPNENHFDYIIIGNGLAGLQLALKFISDDELKLKKVALIDPDDKNKNDKTWSFWEIQDGAWESIIEKSWKTALFNSKSKALTLPLEPYTYKSIRSIDFYKYAKSALKQSENIHFIKDSVVSIVETDSLLVQGKNNTYTTNHVFDSRIPDEYTTEISKYTLVQQHFKGWIIETDTPCFNPEAFTMMDYRFQHNNTTSFVYVLPISVNRALIEYTFFTPETVVESVYDDAIRSYIKNHLKINSYKVIETEAGNIPMTDFPFWKYNRQNVTKIGTGGGWVKGSTGYSFKHTEKNVRKIISNIKSGKQPSYKLFKRKYKFYDKIFLEVLKTNNKKGVWIFEQFYAKNSIPTMFRFLDEESTFTEDLHIMRALFSWDFISAFFRALFRRY
ncbi:lycopene cyclase [Bizionia argentinensis JUB59]|uniref:Lycopene cyclase n=1 Tax=Bizionia argentinensis JUB59 TaxID=1046627 RepID=G2E8X9_9FLAO|nr:lycopene cyclase family protein [Bizionia argentinensis]EGV45097.1 lycopene cyclase [Bizionia argentinensis JUB59]